MKIYDQPKKDGSEFRAVLASSLDQLFAQNEKAVYLDADLVGAIKTGVLFEKYPDRTYNCGIQEANMIGTAAGLANVGMIPFTHTFGTFATRRVFDQVFLSVGYAACPVKMIGSDPGICAEMNGGTHMPFEDIALMRTVPKMMVLEPADSTSLAAMIFQMAQVENACYIRVPRKRKFQLYEDVADIRLGKANVLRDGADVTLIASGILVEQALIAAQDLEKESISAAVLDMHTIKPLDEERVLEYAEKTGAVVTCENHNIVGGLGEAVASVLARSKPTPIEMIGAQNTFGEVGPMDYLAQRFGMTSGDIVVKAKFALSRKS